MQRPVAYLSRFGRNGLTARGYTAVHVPFPCKQSNLLSSLSAKRSYHWGRQSPKTSALSPQTPWRKLSLQQPIRSVSGKPLPQGRSWILNFAYRSAAWLGGSILFLSAGVVVFFLYDASTYREDLSYRDIHVSEIALSPRLGGPKNLPIAEVQIDDDDCAEMQRQKDKPKLVILGGGWGSVALLKTLNPDEYHITLVSPTNYFLFTPMLPSATVGTLEFRSLVEPIRRIVAGVRGHFMRASAENIEFSHKLVEISQLDTDGKEVRFYLPYDKLVIGVGSTTNPHGVKGLENCHFLKDIEDAQKIRNHILTNLEYACLPTTPDAERRRLLSFVVSGGGPTGVEFAAELFDLLNEDITAHFPKILRNEISVHLIQSRGHILNTYDEAVSKYAEARFARDQVEVLTNSRVQEVQPDKIVFTQKDESGQPITKEIPMGFCLWSTGVSQTEFCQKVSAALGSSQTNRHALETDTHLRLNGTPLGDVYAIGDCSTVQNNVADHLVTFVRTLAWETGKDPETMQITFSEWREVAQKVRKRFPQAADHLKRLDKLFEAYDVDQSGTLDFGELRELLMQIDSKLTSLPATAQRAHQQGQYLGHKFNKLARAAPGLKMNDVRDGDVDEAVYKAFEYRHLGSLAYIGNSAVFDLGGGWSVTGGLWAVYAWRSVYFAQSVSFRTRCLLAMDWAKRTLFGRDLMNW
ncbi:External alternative NAD(P)H-ubiquinone oxidoreductase B1, mitochondrial [Lachnellula cervina]|uniref:External alternative NAD(P)H-ubiquinone oxidoreductase B1, mitochondrial n=1 Tax=Lachnellula cervina TaxID=1316786 RepID=A0A7D8YUZ0_9HELO|nr:External alternative NAD(P)H-ubiquinone oxidoreductase B1, mitochondrial [Lachnellula cervina]